MTVSDLILVDDTGRVIAGGKPGRRVVNLAGFQVSSNAPQDNLSTSRSNSTPLLDPQCDPQGTPRGPGDMPLALVVRQSVFHPGEAGPSFGPPSLRINV